MKNIITPTPAAMQASLSAAEAVLVELRARHANTAAQLDWSRKRRQEYEHLLSQHAAYTDQGCVDTQRFWERHPPAAIGAKLKAIIEGGAVTTFPTYENYLDVDGRTQSRSVNREVVLPSLDELQSNLTELDQQVAAAEGDLSDLTKRTRPVLVTDAATKHEAAERLEAELRSVDGELTRATDVEAVVALQTRRQRLPLDINVAQRLAARAQQLVDALGDPDLQTEYDAARAEWVAAEAQLKAALARKLPAEQRVRRATERLSEERLRKLQYNGRLHELEAEWARLTAPPGQSRIVHATTRISGHS